MPAWTGHDHEQKHTLETTKACMQKIIHFTVPKIITPIQRETIERARALHPKWEIKVWQDPIQSDGYLLEKYWPKVNSGAQRADLIRLDVMYRWGGVYVDGDMRLLKPLDVLVESYGAFFASAFGDNLEGALFGARKAHPVIRALIDDLLLNEPDWNVPPDRTTGPDLFARIARWNADVTILPRDTFYSYRPDETHHRKTHRHSYGEHLWEVSWKEPNDRPQNRRVGWKSIIKPLLRPVISGGFHAWHRVKALDKWSPDKSIFTQQPRSYCARGEVVVKTVHGVNVIVDGDDTDMTPRVVFGDDVEMRDEVAAKEILRGGDWIIDVGSRTASFCMLAAQRVERFGRVFVYQSDAKISNLIAKSSVMNRMSDRIIVRPAGVGISEQVGEPNSSGRVPGLDGEFPVDLPIKLLKIDVGCDAAEVLKGAVRLLERRCIDFVYIGVSCGTKWTTAGGGNSVEFGLAT